MTRFTRAALVAVPLAAISAALYTGCMTTPVLTAVVSDYAPVAIGYTWRYYFKPSTGATHYEQWTVDSAETWEGKSAFKIKMQTVDVNGVVTGGTSYDHWFDDGSQLQRDAGLSDCKWITLLNYPPIENTKWTYTCSFFGAVTYDFVTKGREEALLDINSTKYGNCGKVVETTSGTFLGSPYKYEDTHWYAPNVGLVRKVTYDRTTGSSTKDVMTEKQELVAYTVKKPT